MFWTSLPAVALLLLACALLGHAVKSGRMKYVQPGPRPLPLVGNVHQIPKERPWVKFTEWAHIYGDIVHLRIFRESMVCINSYVLAVELFEKRKSVLYANKPRTRMAELSGYGKAVLVQNYTKDLRHSRKIMQTELSPRASLSYRPTQEAEARLFCKRLLDSPSAFLDHIRLSVSSSLLMVAYGYQVEGAEDPLVQLADIVMHTLSDVVTPFSWMVDIFPALMWLPPWFPGFQRTARKHREVLRKFVDMPYERVMAQMHTGLAQPSFVSNQLGAHLGPIPGNDVDILKYTVGAIYAAGTDTSISFISSFFLAMAMYPHVQDKVHDEIDSVLEQSTLPAFSDRFKLVYFECVLKEVLRWHPPVPLLVRSTPQQDVVNGVRIPAGATIVANTWAFAHDPRQYSDPYIFNPERFLSSADKPALNPRNYAFGYGRRICPGMDFADSTSYILLATALALFKILPELDSAGMPIPLTHDYTSGIVSHPKAFQCRLIPRSTKRANLVDDGYLANQ